MQCRGSLEAQRPRTSVTVISVRKLETSCSSGIALARLALYLTDELCYFLIGRVLLQTSTYCLADEAKRQDKISAYTTEMNTHLEGSFNESQVNTFFRMILCTV